MSSVAQIVAEEALGYQVGASDKVWGGAVVAYPDGSAVFVRVWGRRGTSYQHAAQRYGSLPQAHAAYRETAQEKRAKGYVSLGTAGVTATGLLMQLRARCLPMMQATGPIPPAPVTLAVPVVGAVAPPLGLNGTSVATFDALPAELRATLRKRQANAGALIGVLPGGTAIYRDDSGYRPLYTALLANGGTIYCGTELAVATANSRAADERVVAQQGLPTAALTAEQMAALAAELGWELVEARVSQYQQPYWEVRLRGKRDALARFSTQADAARYLSGAAESQRAAVAQAKASRAVAEEKRRAGRTEARARGEAERRERRALIPATATLADAAGVAARLTAPAETEPWGLVEAPTPNTRLLVKWTGSGWECWDAAGKLRPAPPEGARRMVALGRPFVIDGYALTGPHAGTYAATDLLEWDGADLRAQPLGRRLTTLVKLWRAAGLPAPTLGAIAHTGGWMEALYLMLPLWQPGEREAEARRIEAARSGAALLRRLDLALADEAGAPTGEGGLLVPLEALAAALTSLDRAAGRMPGVTGGGGGDGAAPVAAAKGGAA